MKLKVSESLTLANGKTSSACIIDLFTTEFKLVDKKVYSELKAWSSSASMDNGDDHSYPKVSGVKITNAEYDIPQADINQVGTDGHFGIIGQEYVADMKQRVADLLGVNVVNVTVHALI